MEVTASSSSPSYDNKAIGALEGTVVIDGNQNSRKQQRIQTCTGFQVANWNKALQQRKNQSNLFYKGQKVSGTVELQFFRMYGSGLYLFFCFLWKVSIFFLLLSIISIIPITINYLKGNAYSETQSSLQFYITRASIGNYQYSTSQMSYQDSINYKIANVVIDIFTCVAFLGFYFYWEAKSDKIVHQINNSIKLMSASTLQIVKFPQNAKQTDICGFMSRFGQVIQVAPVKNYSNEIQISKQIYQARLEIKQLQMEIQISQDADLSNKIAKLTKKAEQLEQKSQNNPITKQEFIKFYVQMDKTQDKQRIIQKFKPYQKFFTCCIDNPPEQMLLNNQIVWVESCQTEPTGIIWENVHVTWGTRWIRSIVQFIIILLVIVGGFLFISFLNILTPPTTPNIDTTSYTWENIKNESNTTIIRSWCIQNLQINSETLRPVCFQYWKSYIIGILITVGIAVAVIVLKTVIKFLMIFIAKFQKYTSHTEQSVAIMTNLLITYISTTVLITFLIQANVFQISFKSLIGKLISDQQLINNLSLIKQYNDLNSNWYKDIGYQIWFNVFTLSFIPHLYMPLVMHLTECLSQMSAKGQKLHKKMYDKIRPSQFQIEDNYANVMMIILIGFVFGGGSPCMIIVSFVGLISRYVYYKYIFIRFNRVPRTYNQALNKRALTILKVILMIRCFLSLYMYGADDIFAMQKSAFMKWSQQLNLPLFQSIFIVISRLFLTWYYTIFVVAFILCFLFKDLLVDNLIKICKREKKDGQLQQSAQQLAKIQMVSQRILTKSYKLEKNPDYVEILAIMKLKDRKSLARQSIVPVNM